MAKTPLYAIGCNAIDFDVCKAVAEEGGGSIEVQSNVVAIILGSGIIRLEMCTNDLFEGKVVVISVDEVLQDLVGQAWGILIGLFVQFNTPVWVSTYNRQYLEKYGEIADLKINETSGFLMSPESFDKMIS